jgi:hypothetical protein
MTISGQGRRADTWLKVKKDYVDSLADSVAPLDYVAKLT